MTLNVHASISVTGFNKGKVIAVLITTTAQMTITRKTLYTIRKKIRIYRINVLEMWKPKIYTAVYVRR